MELPPSVLTVLVFLALGVAALALFLLISIAPRGGRQLSDSKQAVALLTKHDETLVKLQHALRGVAEDQRRQAAILEDTIQRVGLVRYDAFEDMGGHLSFSTALLDAGGTGVVITSINGRQDSRCYAKAIRSGTGQSLSVEEQEAIRRAMEVPSEPTPEALEGDGRRGRRLSGRGA